MGFLVPIGAAIGSAFAGAASAVGSAATTLGAAFTGTGAAASGAAGAAATGAATAGATAATVSPLVGAAAASSILGAGAGLYSALNPPKLPAPPAPPQPASPTRGGNPLFQANTGSLNGTFFGGAVGTAPAGGGGKTLLGQ